MWTYVCSDGEWNLSVQCFFFFLKNSTNDGELFI